MSGIEGASPSKTLSLDRAPFGLLRSQVGDKAVFGRPEEDKVESQLLGSQHGMAKALINLHAGGGEVSL